MKKLIVIFSFLSTTLFAQFERPFFQIGGRLRPEIRQQTYIFETGLYYKATNHGIQTHARYVSNKSGPWFVSLDIYYISFDYFYALRFKKFKPLVCRFFGGLGYMYQTRQIDNEKRYGFGPSLGSDVIFKYKNFGIAAKYRIGFVKGYAENVYSFTVNGISNDFKIENGENVLPEITFALTFNI